MSEVANERIDALEGRLAEVEGYLHVEEARGTVAELERQSAEPGFWDDANAARETMAKLARAKEDVAGIDAAHEKLEDARAAWELGQEMEDEDLLAECEANLDSLEHDLSELELASWFTGEFDGGDAIVNITPGQGGLEAQDWCSMLLHMYLRYCERRGWKVTINDAPAAEQIGIDRATITVSGKNAYGMLRAEQGVHRLVRISPTDAKKRRQTTFAGVEVLPVTADSISYTLAFKEAFWALSLQGYTGTAAFRKLGYNTEVLGFERIHNTTKRIRREARSPEGFHEGARGGVRIPGGGNSQTEGASAPPDEAARRMKREILCLQQQMAFLKKVMRLHGKPGE